MHNATRMVHATRKTVFERVRKARSLRLVSVILALLAFQNSFACICDGSSGSTDAAIVVTESASTLDDGCCALCSTCTYCGCCSAIAGPQGSASVLGSHASAGVNTLATSAELNWRPPTPLKPPIQIV
jgi:hypothetical protein